MKFFPFEIRYSLFNILRFCFYKILSHSTLSIFEKSSIHEFEGNFD